MKICMFTMDECGQFYISARRAAKVLAEAGHDVRIIAFMGSDTPPCEESNGFRILRINLLSIRATRRLEEWLRKTLVKSKRNESALGWPQPAANVDRRSSATPTQGDVRVSTRFSPKALVAALASNIYWNLFRAAVYLTYLEYYWRSFRLARREPADVYHAHDLNALPVAWMSSRASKGKLIYDSHELWLDRERRPPRSRPNRFLVKRLESFLIHRADVAIIAGVSSGQELSRRYHVEPIVIHNAWFYRPFTPSSVLRDEMGVAPDKKILLYVGVLNLSRGLEESIRSLTHLPNCTFIMLGWGSEEYVSALKRLAASEGVTERVFFHGPVSFDQITPYAMSADIGLILIKNVGLNYYYVSPNKVFQHMVAGLPTVGSYFPDLEMFIKGYNFGVTCNPESPRDIAKAVDYILSDPDRYILMRANALEAAKVFNWENEGKKLVASYEHLSQKALR